MIFYSGHPRFVSRSGIQRAGKRHHKRRDNRYENNEAKLPVHAFWSKDLILAAFLTPNPH
jgi:hypothetical protein